MLDIITCIIYRSLDWVCPTCGVVNRTALPDEDKETSNNTDNVTEEMREIVSQMAIKVCVVSLLLSLCTCTCICSP